MKGGRQMLECLPARLISLTSAIVSQNYRISQDLPLHRHATVLAVSFDFRGAIYPLGNRKGTYKEQSAVTRIIRTCSCGVVGHEKDMRRTISSLGNGNLIATVYFGGLDWVVIVNTLGCVDTLTCDGFGQITAMT